MKSKLLESLVRKLPVSLATFAAASKRMKEEQGKTEKRLLGRLDRLESMQTDVIVELDLIRDRVTSLLDDAFLSRQPIYEDTARCLARSLQDMSSLSNSSVVKLAFITDSGYAVPTAVAISSILRHRNPSTKYEVAVVASGLSQADAALFKSFGDAVKLIEVGNKYANLFAEHHHVSEVALLKFDLPKIFPDSDKILYLDGDILVFDDLSELYDTDLNGRRAAVVKDYRYCLKGFAKMLGNTAYFNSGVMLLNADLLRKIGVAEKLLEAKKREPVNAFMDQTAFNMVLGDDVEYLSPKFNMLQTSFRKQSVGSFRKIAEFYGLGEGEFERIFEHPTILHLAGKLKPWSSKFAPSYERWQDEMRIFTAFRSLTD